MTDAPPDAATLRLAVALADTGDLGATGTAFGIGRRTVAARIAQLERKVGAVLFDHAGKRVRLTAAGEAFIGEARLALAATDRAGRLARAIADRPLAVAIGVTTEALFGPVRALLEDPAFVDSGLALAVHVMTREDQAAALADGRLAIGFVAPPLPALPRVQHHVVATSKWSAVVPDAEARLRKTASLSQLARKPLVTLEADAAGLARHTLTAALRATGAEPAFMQEAPDWSSVMAMVALGLGSALVPSIVAKRLAIGGATVLPLVEAESLAPWAIHAIWLPQPAGTAAAQAIALVRSRLD
ncbi:LysR family transcriptional regulator [Phreatobacter sp.]|uniref:LysR family transcriptional regulator n=1 Tax=Phreatobacter sp. TaxID=1966341 RepID=UPI003F70D419